MIAVKITDGLGNQMFQYAFARSLQIRSGQEVCLDVRDVNQHMNQNSAKSDMMQFCDERTYSLDQYRITLPTVRGRKLSRLEKQVRGRHRLIRYCREFKLIPEQGTRLYLDESAYKKNGDVFFKHLNYYLEGYFFDKSYWEENTEILRKEFQLKRELILSEEIRKVLMTKNTVSIHFRRTDFLRAGRDMSDGHYYDSALKFMVSQVSCPFLLIFSDDIEWVKKNKSFQYKHMYISGRGFSDSEELTIMSMCKHHIIANSTYSYWGAWLNPDKEKIVAAPKGWKEKIIPDTWILI